MAPQGAILLLTGDQIYASTTDEPGQSGPAVQPQFVQDEGNQHAPATGARRLPPVKILRILADWLWRFQWYRHWLIGKSWSDEDAKLLDDNKQ